MNTKENVVKSCNNCCWHSGGFAPAKPGWCYKWDYEVVPTGICDDGWQASLRDEPLNDPPVRPDLEVLHED